MFLQHVTRAGFPAGSMRAGRTAAFAITMVWAGTVGLHAQETNPPFDYDQAGAGSDLTGTYGYVRSLDGSATLIQSDGERVEVDANEPVLVGDRLFVTGGSRAEILLADRNIVRLGDRADLGFRALAHSADATDPATVVDLSRGTAQVVVVEDQLADDFPTVITPNASIRLREPGAYLIVVDDDEATEVVVREGRAEVRTEDDGAEVRAGESLSVDGRRGASLAFETAPSIDRLERWGNGLADYDDDENDDYVDEDLRYSASSLEGHGSWVDVDGSYAWRPYVSVGWAPYRYGRWRYTPSGLFWVSYEPWGWTPYHYGYWNHHSTFGWVWYPGHRFAGAHVYWFWGNGYAGWIPSGYYTSYYGHHYGSSFGYPIGVYGYLGGDGWYRRNRYWTFLPTNRLGSRRQHLYELSGYELGRRGRSLGRGILTTDTRALRPDVWRRPAEGIARLTREGTRSGRTLVDTRPFVDRVERLPTSLERVTLRGRDARSRVSGGSATARDTRHAGEARQAGGTLRSNAGDLRTRRPTVETRTRSADGRSSRLAPRTRTTGPTGSLRRPGGSLRRPEAARPTNRRPTIDRGSERRVGERQPEVRSRPTSGSTLRRPSRPVARTRSIDRTRPIERRGTQRPVQVRPEPRSAPRARPTLDRRSPPRESARAPSARTRPSRPVVRTPPSRSRPTVRSSSGSSRSRPTVRSSPRSSRSRPAARSSGGGRSSGAARSSGTSRGGSGRVSRSRRSGGR